MPEYSSTENIVAVSTKTSCEMYSFLPFSPQQHNLQVPNPKTRKMTSSSGQFRAVIVALIYAHFAWASIYFIKNTGMIPPMVLSKLCNNNSKKK
jgi:hypothetical protein